MNNICETLQAVVTLNSESVSTNKGCCACNKCPICLIRRLCKETWDRYQQEVKPRQERYSVFEGGPLPVRASFTTITPGITTDRSLDQRTAGYQKSPSEIGITKRSKIGKKDDQESDEDIVRKQIKKKTKKQKISDDESEVDTRKGDKLKKVKKGQLPSETDLNKSAAKGKKGTKGKAKTLEEKSDEDLGKDIKSRKVKKGKIEDELQANKKKGGGVSKATKRKDDEQADNEGQKVAKSKKSKKGEEKEDDLQRDKRKDKVSKGGKKKIEDESEIPKGTRKGKKGHVEEDLQTDKKKVTAVPKGGKKKAEDQVDDEVPKRGKAKKDKKGQSQENLQIDNKKRGGVSKGGKKKIEQDSVDEIRKGSKLRKGRKEQLIIELDVDRKKEAKVPKGGKKTIYSDQLEDTLPKAGKPSRTDKKSKRQGRIDDDEPYAKGKNAVKDTMKAAKSIDTFGDGDKARSRSKNKREIVMDASARQRGRNAMKDTNIDRGDQERTTKFSNRNGRMARRSDTDIVARRGGKYRSKSAKKGYLSDDDTSFDASLDELPVKKGKGRILLAPDYMRLRLEQSDLKRMTMQHVICPPPCQPSTSSMTPCPCDPCGAMNYCCPPLDCL
ncbi:unnamed protein product [Hermetia illucens]|uniref:Uncharacterized protein n=1 Tax=Hermetia illucens TaxID=343691 RepID=A0A7R8UFH1_HERIL|nr:unnamed protein product [Hermetia illucens]